MDGVFLTRLVLWYGVFLFSTTIHEAMHSYASLRGGDPTAHRSGLATLNPVPHMKRSPVGMVAVPLIVFLLNGGQWMIGWASAPFNSLWAARYPWRSFVMALAGPLSHLVITTVAAVFMIMGLASGYFEPYSVKELDNMVQAFDMFPVAPVQSGHVAWAVALLLNVVFHLNLILFFFNILPVPPLDGSAVWYLFARSEEERLRWRMTFESYWIVGLALAWYIFPRYFGYLLGVAVALVYLIGGALRGFLG